MTTLSPRASRAAAPESELEQLRSILIGHDQTLAQRTHDRLANVETRTRDVGEVLPQALATVTARDPAAAPSARPLVEGAIQASVRRDPGVLAEALFPAIGPAIRRAVADALQTFARSLNQGIEHAMSWEGLRWRFESWRTGRPFADVVLRHTMLYRAEQAFLIHKETGLLLQHVTSPSLRDHQDADLVSSMLTAIQDFARDSFALDKDDHLEHVQLGDLTIWIESGPRALLAAVVRGHAPAEYRNVLQAANEKVHARFGGMLREFNGDPKPFETADALLAACLVEEHADRPAPTLWRVWVVGGILAVVLAAAGFQAYSRHAQWQAYLTRVRAEPGLVVVSASRGILGREVAGLRDALATDPATLLAGAGLSPERVTATWEPFQSLHPSVTLKRAQSLLAPPPSVTLAVEGDVLAATGAASHEWIGRLRTMARFVPGVAGVDDTRLTDADHERLAARALALEERALPFAVAATRIASKDRAMFDAVVADLSSFMAEATRAGLDPRVTVRGRTDTYGSRETNERIALARATFVADALVAAGAARGAIAVEPVPAGPADSGAVRAVSFRIALAPTARPAS
ncbi:MAG: hypothetical protein U0Q12_18630 [Vicinamibacterales bacterium]